MLRRTFVPISPDRMYVCSMVRASVLVCWQKDMLERLTDLNVSDAIFTNLHKKEKKMIELHYVKNVTKSTMFRFTNFFSLKKSF